MIPLRLCLLGLSYSGKDMIGKFIERKYGLKVFSMQEIVNELVVERMREEIGEENYEGIKIMDEAGSAG